MKNKNYKRAVKTKRIDYRNNNSNNSSCLRQINLTQLPVNNQRIAKTVHQLILLVAIIINHKVKNKFKKMIYNLQVQIII